MKLKKLTITETEYVAFYLAKKFMEWDEPIPDFSTRFPNVLESCLATPFSSFGGKNAYQGITGKAAMFFYLMIKNHPFKNGNKRIAMTTLMYFLHKNRQWLKVDEKEFYNFAKWVAESGPKFKDETIKAIQKFIGAYMVKLH